MHRYLKTLKHIVHNRFLLPRNEDGFLLVVTMFILVVLTLIGISATNLTTVELQIAGNDRVHKETFYQADGATEIGMRLVFDNAICTLTKGGFTGNYGASNTFARIGNSIVVEDLTFSNATTLTKPSDINRDAAYYPGVNLTAGPAHTTYDSGQNTNLNFKGRTKKNAGHGMQMVSGYDGLGASSPGSVSKEYTVASQHQGSLNSESLVTILWQVSGNVLNSASSSDCKY